MQFLSLSQTVPLTSYLVSWSVVLFPIPIGADPHPLAPSAHVMSKSQPSASTLTRTSTTLHPRSHLLLPAPLLDPLRLSLHNRNVLNHQLPAPQPGHPSPRNAELGRQIPPSLPSGQKEITPQLIHAQLPRCPSASAPHPSTTLSATST